MKTAFAAIGGIIGLLLLIGGIGTLFESPKQRAANDEDSWKQDAHYAAQQFITQTYPGAKVISNYRDSVVLKTANNEYSVGVMVDGINGFGGPIKKKVGVIMTLEDNKWHLQRIDQQ